MDDQTNDKKIKSLATYGALLLVAAAVSYYIYADLKKGPEPETASTSGEPSAQISEVVGNTGISGARGIAPETKIVASLTMPKLNRPIPNNPALSEEARTILSGRIKELSDRITKESNNSESWVYLGVEYKMAGDYEGAREAWEYAAYLSPDFVAHQNLGDLYAYYLHDNTKAEREFLEAIRLSPTSEFLYFKAAEFYRDVLKDSAKARAIAERGVTAIPSSSDLKSLLSSLR